MNAMTISKGKRIIEFAELMKEWDYEKNELDPAKTAAGCHEYAWWICEKDHSWSAVIKNRTINESKCPYCTNKKVLAGYNDLATKNPALAEEWYYPKNDGITPEMVTPFSSRVVWWKCENDHIWDMSIAHRSGGYKCPICTNKRVLAGYNDLLTKNPKLAAEWDYDKNTILPSEVTVSSSKKVFWKCTEGHSWLAKIAARNLGGTDCPTCDSKVIKAGFNDLQTRYPELAKEWDTEKNDLLPSQVAPFSTKKVWWRCIKEGHSWFATISGRSTGNDCPICSGRKVLIGYNDLKTVNPILADEWDYEKNDKTPEQVTSKPKSRITCTQIRTASRHRFFQEITCRER